MGFLLTPMVQAVKVRISKTVEVSSRMIDFKKDLFTNLDLSGNTIPVDLLSPIKPSIL